MSDAVKLIIQVDGEEGADAEEIDALTNQLLEEIENLSEKVEAALPQDAKAGGAVTLGALSVALLPTVIPKLVDFLKDWMMRGAGTIRIKIPELEAEFPANMSPEKLQEFITLLKKEDKG